MDNRHDTNTVWLVTLNLKIRINYDGWCCCEPSDAYHHYITYIGHDHDMENSCHIGFPVLLREQPDNLSSDSQAIEEEVSSLEEARLAAMHNNCRSGLPTLGVSLQQRIEVGMLYEA
ncbi:hypothetical protein L195_g010239 [Trifolium pratense]|uniref:Uncharacterized protein n=1 Tax=Trifolium pratense TaxID=57577 RepID=A0A2K3PE62_TRIPR|nr:hypothetical protein L195_g010239 [Trifolium pratense]